MSVASKSGFEEGEYRAIRDRRYFVRHGHEVPNDERVLITTAGYSVVEQG
jgi:hypothetical protein